MCLQWWWISLTCRKFYIKYDMFLESFSSELHIIYRYALCIMHTLSHQEASTRMSVTSLLVKNWTTQMSNIRMDTLCVCVCSGAQLCPTLCNPTDYSPPGSCVHGIFPGKNTRVGCHFLLQMDAIAMCYIAMAMRTNTLLWRALHGWMFMDKMLSKNEKPKRGTHCMIRFERKAHWM